MSFNGGNFTLAASRLSPSSYISINGFQGRILSYSSSSVTYAVPPLVTNASQTAFALATDALLDKQQFTFFSDQPPGTSNVSAAFDGQTTTYYGSGAANCWLGLDAGANMGVSVSRIRFFPSFDWPNAAQKILHAVFEGSNDNNSWTEYGKVDQTVHTGWNVLKTTMAGPVRYIRFRHNSTSQCNLAEFNLYGILFSTLPTSLASQPTDVIYNDGLNSQTFSSALEFRQDHTAIVTAVTPRYGDIFGGYTLTLNGTNLGGGTVTITIDGVDCPVAQVTAIAVTCTVGARTGTYNKTNTFAVVVGGSNAIIKDSFLYVLKWSNPTTWGTDIPPVDNDLVYVPLGTTLLVDQNTPVLEGIAVQGGTLVFSDDLDLTVQVGFITMNGGRFIAGTEQHPHTHRLNFTLHGDYYGKQQPMFGNKGIGCLNCRFSLYGQPPSHTWTSLAATLNPGDTTLTLSLPVDWKVGDQIVVASTSFDHHEAESKTITAVSDFTLTLDSPFVYKHVSVV
jgi:hypothetical protein